MFLKNETLRPEPEKNIRITWSKYLTHGWEEVSEPITPDWCEGPTAIKINGWWIVYFDMYRKHQMGAVTSEDLINWNNITDDVHFPEGTRHGTVFETTVSVLERIKD